jgi:hypothetical protein
MYVCSTGYSSGERSESALCDNILGLRRSVALIYEIIPSFFSSLVVLSAQRCQSTRPMSVHTTRSVPLGLSSQVCVCTVTLDLQEPHNLLREGEIHDLASRFFGSIVSKGLSHGKLISKKSGYEIRTDGNDGMVRVPEFCLHRH